jgi:eukaryotic-like serine/threonine-protein kinase
VTSISTGSHLGRYEVQDLIARGGMGEVYRARDVRLNRPVALKVLAPRFVLDDERLARFTQEARTTARLSHPNIVAVYDVDSHLGVPYVVSELLDGSTLRAQIKAGGLTLHGAIGYALDIARGLVAAHQLGVVHRDLKPENVFVTRDNRVKILDFGLAKVRGDSLVCACGDCETNRCLSRRSSISTAPGILVGTVGYAAPEQVRGVPADHRADIFSLGIILYEMLAGTAPFRGDSAVETLHAILKEEPVPLRERDRTMPIQLDDIVRHCLEKDRDMRFQSAHDFAFSLELVRRSIADERRIASRPSARDRFASFCRFLRCGRRTASGRRRSIYTLPAMN